MKSSVFMTPSGGRASMPGARHEPQLAVGHDALGRLQALLDDRLGAEPHAGRDQARFDGLIRLHDEHVGALLTGLDRLRGHDDRRAGW